jgi:predicted nucleotidyltransferase
MIKTIVEGLGNLLSDVVFVGGAVTELYSSNIEASDDVRMTEDVDVVVQIESLHSFHELEEKLRLLGFKNDFSQGAPICRWIYKDVKLDVMPNESSVLGFSNRWYTPGI